jgi:hypothetical protein
LFSVCASKDDISVHFDVHCKKAFVEFKNSSLKIATNVEFAVYLAVAMK